MIHRFGAFEADARRFELRRAGRVVPVQRRVLETILFLAQSGGKLITRDDLMAGPWQGTVVSDAAFKQAIMHARRALVDPDRQHRFIVTVHGKGFRWADLDAGITDRHAVPGGLGPSAVQAEHALGVRVGHSGAGVVSARGALEKVRVVLQHLREYDDPLRMLDIQLLEAHWLQQLGVRGDFKQGALQHARVAAECACPAHDWYAGLLATALAYHEGRVTEAHALLLADLPRAKRFVGPCAGPIVAAHLLNLAFELTGGAKQRALRAATRLAGLGNDANREAPANQLLTAVAQLHLGNTSAAQRGLESLQPEISKLSDNRALLPMLVNLADLCVSSDDKQRLAAIYRRFEPFVGLTVVRDFSDWGPVSYHMGRVARALGDNQAARKLLERARLESKQAGSTCWQLWSTYGLCRVLQEAGNAGNSRRAARLLDSVRRSARRLELPALTQFVAP